MKGERFDPRMLEEMLGRGPSDQKVLSTHPIPDSAVDQIYELIRHSSTTSGKYALWEFIGQLFPETVTAKSRLNTSNTLHPKVEILGHALPPKVGEQGVTALYPCPKDRQMEVLAAADATDKAEQGSDEGKYCEYRFWKLLSAIFGPAAVGGDCSFSANLEFFGLVQRDPHDEETSSEDQN